MRPSTAVMVVGLVIFVIAAAPLVEFAYFTMGGRAISVRMVAAANSTYRATCSGSDYYVVAFSYDVPVPLANARVWTTLVTPSGNFTYSKAPIDLTQGSNVTLCIPSSVVSEARAVDVGISGSIAGLYPIEIEEQVSVGG